MRRVLLGVVECWKVGKSVGDERGDGAGDETRIGDDAGESRDMKDN